MSAQPVDVLAWIGERVAAHEALSECDAFHAQELPKAQAVRAAVAELIEADTEFDAAYAEFPEVGSPKRDIDAGAARINAARARRAAAIARIGGATS